MSVYILIHMVLAMFLGFAIIGIGGLMCGFGLGIYYTKREDSMNSVEDWDRRIQYSLKEYRVPQPGRVYTPEAWEFTIMEQHVLQHGIPEDARMSQVDN